MSTVELVGSAIVSPDRTTFAGRKAEIEHLHMLVQRALEGHGSIVLLGGEPGVGKTRLALEAADYASRFGFGFLMGRCYEGEDLRPHLPFAEIIEMALNGASSMDEFRAAIADNAPELAQIAPRLRQLFPDIAPLPKLPPQDTRRYLFQGVSETFMRVARREPLFLLLDDLQWADESSLALLTYLANRVARIRVVVVATYRDRDLDINSTIVWALEELQRIGIRPIGLRGLSEGEVGMMLRGLSRRDPPGQLVKLVFYETRGNPFFVEELYRYLTEEKQIFDTSGQFHADVNLSEIDLPETVRLVVGRRLERLGQGGKHVLTAGAVIGCSFSFKLLETVLSDVEIDELLTAVEQAQRMGLIVSSAERPEAHFRFAHEIVRQTLLADTLLPSRQRLHLLVANAIEKLYAKSISEHAAEIAVHLVRADSASDRQRTAHYLFLAGNAALLGGRI
jgi:predicted ATPase